jgi:hypothetical protein
MLLRDVAYVIAAWFDVLDNRLERMARNFNTRGRKNTSTSSRGELEPDNITTIRLCREFPPASPLLDDGAPSPPSELSADQRNRSLGWMPTTPHTFPMRKVLSLRVTKVVSSVPNHVSSTRNSKTES